MSSKNLFDEINADVKDIQSTGFEYLNTNLVPHRKDGQLTFEREVIKKGKVLKSCVLFVDIRDSVSLNEKHHLQTMGRLYTAFTKAVLKVAKHHSGHVRNIIGDRVMVVFPAENCYENAVDCAITINHVVKYIINKQFKDVEFKCGIGIDYGELKVIKVGIRRQGSENIESRNLVWVGYPANIASRLTDIANKNFQETTFILKYNPRNWENIMAKLKKDRKSLHYFKPYLNSIKEKHLSTEDFLDLIQPNDGGIIKLKNGRYVSHEKRVSSHLYSPILMTQEVFNGFRKECPKRIHDLWKKQNHNINNVKTEIYGGDIIWKDLQ